MKPAAISRGNLRPPAQLTRLAVEEWRRLAPMARRNGTLSAETARSFELLVETLATERQARELIAEEGLTVQTGRGGAKAHPAARSLDAARAQAAVLLKLFRLEPGKPTAAPQPRKPNGASPWRGVLK